MRCRQRAPRGTQGTRTAERVMRRQSGEEAHADAKRRNNAKGMAVVWRSAKLQGKQICRHVEEEEGEEGGEGGEREEEEEEKEEEKEQAPCLCLATVHTQAGKAPHERGTVRGPRPLRSPPPRERRCSRRRHQRPRL